MVTINSSTVRQNVYETIYDTLTAANLLGSTVTVTSAYIDRDDAPFPQVVVSPVDVDMDSFTFDRSFKVRNMTIDIDIWTKKNKDKDAIADEIDSLLSGLKIDGVSLVDWSESNALETPGQNKIHLKTIRIAYARG
jgi:hypothetical protein